MLNRQGRLIYFLPLKREDLFERGEGGGGGFIEDLLHFQNIP